MKHVKKLASLLLALVMVVAMSTTALAATVTNNTDHSYNAYQIFSGTQAEGNAALGDVEWGTGISSDTFLAELQTDNRFMENDANIFASCTTAAEVATVLGKYEDKSDVANAFANVAAKHLTSTSTSIAVGASEATLSPGYYLLVDTSTPGEGDAMNSALLQVTNKGNITIEKKYDAPSVNKSVKDTDDNWCESADWEIGSDVPFQIVGTLPSNYDDYETYKYVFHDTLQDTLKYNDNSYKVYAYLDGNLENTVETNKVDITDSFTIAEDCKKAGCNCNLTFTCADLKSISGVSLTSASEIVVEYTAELLSTAEIGQPGNKNEVYLEYSNNPNFSGEGEGPTGNTPKDEVLVFTYELDVTKVDGQDSSKKLPNAEFVLLNKDKDKVAEVTEGKFVQWVNMPEASDDGTITYPQGTTLISGNDGKFVIAGLDAGSYYLRETKAPAGYNLLKNDISVTITATLDKSEDNPALAALTIKVDNGNEANGALDTGIVSTDVVNNSGSTLPETGGMGTTIFYILGAIMVCGAAILLITKRRMRAE